MIPWEFIDSAVVPGSDRELLLYRRGEEYSLRVAGVELMNSRQHGSEDALAVQTCDRLSDLLSPSILIGGLGMGFTVAAALQRLSPTARLVVAELVPQVVAWNRDQLAHLAGNPLADPRVTVRQGDVGLVIREEQEAWDGILLDVDNGPDGLTSRDNDQLYSRTALDMAWRALRPGGLLAVWSVAGDPVFTRRLRQAGFIVDEVRVRSRGRCGSHHTLWFARRDFRQSR